MAGVVDDEHVAGCARGRQFSHFFEDVLFGWVETGCSVIVNGCDFTDTGLFGFGDYSFSISDTGERVLCALVVEADNK